MARRKQVYEGKAKILFEGPEPGTLIQYFKDDATAFNNQKRAVLEGKGVANGSRPRALAGLSPSVRRDAVERLVDVPSPTRNRKRYPGWQNMSKWFIRK